MSHIQENLTLILQRIERACIANNRDPKEVKLLLATKTVPAARIRIALQAGQTLLGENKVQEIKEKYDELLDLHPTNHFIGHLQTNKIKDILKYNITCIHSVDRLDLATKLHQRLALENKTMDILIQVNTSNEDSKFGVAPAYALELIQEVAKLNTLHIKGLMTIGLFSADEIKIRACFKILKDVQEQAKQLHLHNVEMNELSMGMSGDLEIAVAEGATIVRVGTAIFGERIYPDSYYWNENK
ncbi:MULTISPECIES: YggS family pyridoxal phosphate-dependent enzyme [unclassified Myroides]|uniref:YggS family pyridoxal phosphate-dependent enzyme n=1 Tax=unclassified Myroides TaxID=2642485 RepID=UPI0015FC6B61|nr:MULTISPECIES: YggS family pyridoxal phosphate-dependent enzyme [unclassified Myroides]MBB1151385.1 YggS family pyridoxal phosphate-dependent enzyme [Myroides sp. NP-2]MDM1409046.1 YggS family pyridoxal phosphate-dependent enzyme [Myroides sp. DF42-4-2]